MNKPDISKLVQQAVTLKKESEVSLVDVHQTLVAGRTALRNSALHQYQATFALLQSAIGNYTGSMFVMGPGALAFSKVAEEEGPALTLDASELYRKVAEAWFPTVRVDRVFALDCIITFLDGVSGILPPLGVSRIAPPEFGKYFGRPVSSLQDAVDITRDILRETVGDDLNGLYINHRLTEKVVETAWHLKVVPVVVINATEPEIAAQGGLFTGLFYGRNILVNTKEIVEKDEVLSAFKQLRVRMNPARQPSLPLND